MITDEGMGPTEGAGIWVNESAEIWAPRHPEVHEVP